MIAEIIQKVNDMTQNYMDNILKLLAACRSEGSTKDFMYGQAMGLANTLWYTGKLDGSEHYELTTYINNLVGMKL